MRKSNFLNGFLCVSALFAMVSCSNSVDKIEGWPVQLENKDNWSMINSDGVLIYENEFENMPSAIVNGYFTVKESKGYVLYKAEDKKYKAVDGCSELYSVGAVSEGLIPMSKKESRIIVADNDGVEKFELKPVDGHEIVGSKYKYQNGMLAVLNDESKWGFVDKKGEMIIKPQYDFVSDFENGVSVCSKDSKLVVVDKDGNVKAKLKESWDLINTFLKYNAIVVKDSNSRVLIVDKDGESIKCPERVKYISEMNDKYYVFADEEWHFGVAERESGEIIVRAKYSSVYIMPDDKFICNESDDEADIMDAQGTKVMSVDDYKYVIYNEYLGMVGREKNTYEMLDKEGRPIRKAEFAYMGDLETTSLVYSSYFDITPIITVMTNLASGKDVGGFALGKTAASVLEGQPSKYAGKTSVEVPAATFENPGIYVNTTAYFRNVISRFTLNYDTFVESYVWTPENSLIKFETSFNFDKELSEGNFNKCIEALKEAGFKVGATKYEDGYGEAVLSNDKATAQIVLSDGGTSLSYVLESGISKNNYEKLVDRIKTMSVSELKSTPASKVLRERAVMAVQNVSPYLEDWGMDDLWY